MKRSALLLAALCAIPAAGCKKKTGGPTGGAWVVGPHGLMANLPDDGSVGAPYSLGSDEDLEDITCRGKDVAFVVGDHGTMLRTYDGGASWDAIDLGTTAHLRAVAAQRSDTIYVAGDRTLIMSPDSGTSWHALPVDAGASWISVGAGHWSFRALALDTAGNVVSYDVAKDTITPVATLAGARAVAVSNDGTRAAVVGAGRTLLRSDDAGSTWRTIDLGADYDLHDAWVTAAGEIIAVGADGAIATIERDDSVSVDRASTAGLNALRLEADGRGLAVGDEGIVLRTVDHGLTWNPIAYTLGGTVSGVDTTDGDGW